MAQTHFLTTSIVIFATLYQALADGPPDEEAINILSYNVQAFGPTLQWITGGSNEAIRIEPLPKTAAEAVTSAPDLICFQEAFSGKFNEIVEKWTETSGYKKIGPTFGSKWRRQFLNSGVILLSKTEFDRFEEQTFKAACGMDGFAAKGFLYAETTIRGRRIGVVATHLQADDQMCAWPWSSAEAVAKKAQSVREKQLIQIKDFLEKEFENREQPEAILLVGDLNIDSWDGEDKCPKFDNIKGIIEGTVQGQAPTFLEGKGQAQPTKEGGEAQPTKEGGEAQPATEGGEAQTTTEGSQAQPTMTQEIVLKASYDSETNAYCKATGTYHLDYVLALKPGRSQVQVKNQVVQVRTDDFGDLSDHHAVLGRVTFAVGGAGENGEL